MYITVYIGNKPLFLCADEKEINESIIPKPAYFCSSITTDDPVEHILQQIDLPDYQAAIVESPQYEELVIQFFSKYTLIKAAGGFVENDLRQILLIHRRGKWDLPKGKLDPGETIETCAVREVMEETGLQTITLRDKMLTTYHTYSEQNRPVLKETHWYKMLAPGIQSIQLQTEEDITDYKWISLAEWPLYAQHTFPSILDLFKLEQQKQATH